MMSLDKVMRVPDQCSGSTEGMYKLAQNAYPE